MLARLQKYLQMLGDFLGARGIAGEPPFVDRVCPRCLPKMLAVAQTVAYTFDDAGACCHCGAVTSAVDSAAVVAR
jgi:hypothetical protein